MKRIWKAEIRSRKERKGGGWEKSMKGRMEGGRKRGQRKRRKKGREWIKERNFLDGRETG